MKIRKKVTKSQKIIITIGTILLFFILTFLIIKDNRNLTFIEKIVKDGVLFINETIMYPFNLLNDDNKLKKIEEQIQTKNQNEINNLKKEVQELKESLELKNLLSDYEIINATVVNRNLGYWYNTITIDKGSKNNIKENMAVITSSGLIGKVIKTTRHNSTIKLLTSDDTNNKVSIQIKVDNGYQYGILTSFDINTNEYMIEGITDTKNIKAGSIVSTTGMGDIFPSGILIGEVTTIEKDNFDLAAIIKVRPNINIDNFNYVQVLRRKQ